MNGTPLNILEMLNSSSPVLLGEQPDGIDNALDNSQVSFNELIESLLVKGNLGSNQQAFDLLGLKEGAVPEELTAGKIFSNLLNDNQKNILIDNINIEAGEITKKEDAQNVIAFNNELEELNLKSNPVINKNFKNLLKSHPVNLPDGKYEIEKSEISEGKLNLELKTDNPKAENIKLSIPVELLKDGLDNSGLKNPLISRANLDILNQKDVEIKELFSKLNLEKLEIENIKSFNAENKLEPDNKNKSEFIKLNIVGKDNGSEILIKNKLNKIHVKQEELKERDVFKKSDFDFPKAEKIETKTIKDILKPQSKQNTELVNNNESLKTIKGASLDKENIWARNNFDLSGLKESGSKLESNIKDNLLNQQGMFGKASGKGSNFVETTKLETGNIFNINNSSELTDGGISKTARGQQMRFILPENIQTTLKPNGQSVMLRINPEHLGPARLNLTLVNNKLRARVIVNSPAAQSILENSVDRLVEQLAKADIKVDSIDISVSGEEANNEFTERHNHWQRKIASRNLKLEDNIDNNQQINAIQPSTTNSTGYMNAGGVNLLA
jgi:flagellar hook-length control protein FliK